MCLYCMQEQMQERHEQQAAARLEFERERTMVDAVMQAIEEEDRLQGEMKRKKAAETMMYIHDFIADRDARRERQRQAEFDEERKIQVGIAGVEAMAFDRTVRITGQTWRLMSKAVPSQDPNNNYICLSYQQKVTILQTAVQQLRKSSQCSWSFEEHPAQLKRQLCSAMGYFLPVCMQNMPSA